MPIFPPRSTSIRKEEILDARIFDLQRSVEKNCSTETFHRKIEKVRQAKLNLIKAQLHLLQIYRGEDNSQARKRQVIELKLEAFSWSRKSIEKIWDLVKED